MLAYQSVAQCLSDKEERQAPSAEAIRSPEWGAMKSSDSPAPPTIPVQPQPISADNIDLDLGDILWDGLPYLLTTY